MFSVPQEFIPVTGYTDGNYLEVIPQYQRYILPWPIILRLKEKFFCWSGDDFTVNDINGYVWFKIDSKSFSLRDRRTLLNSEGMEIAGYHKKLFSLRDAAYITQEWDGITYVYATIRKSSYFAEFFTDDADIFIHNPPLCKGRDNLDTDGISPHIIISGDFFGKNYDFMMGSAKVAQVVKKWRWFTTSTDTYFVNIGPNIDVAFICMCVMAIDELYHDE